MRVLPALAPRLAASALIVAILAAALVAQALWLFRAEPADAEMFEVHLVNYEFVVPQGLPGQEQCEGSSIPCLAITEGDSVTFIWDEGTHSVTGDEPGLTEGLAYDSGVQTAPYQQTFTFKNDTIITFRSTVQADIEAGMQMRLYVNAGKPTPPPTDTATSEPTSTPTTGPSPTPGASVELFEGWNPVNSWGGPALQGDGITDYLNTRVEPNTWEAAARFNGEVWQQRFKAPPLPSFNTLNEIEPGQQIWLFVLQDALLTY